MQAFEFKPIQGPFWERLEDLEIVCFPLEDGVKVLMEIDCKVRALHSLVAETMETDESYVRCVFGEAALDDLTRKLSDVIAARV